MDQFYALVTGQEDAFYQMCMVLPKVIEKAVSEMSNSTIPVDTVFEELLLQSDTTNGETTDVAIALAVYLLGFPNYTGFAKK